jgi:hypothetical protein
MLAPRERDLMFVIGGISASFINPQQEAWRRAGYGPIAIDPLALAYYCYAWALSDIGDFAAQVALRPDLGPVSREAALNACMGLFAPGEISRTRSAREREISTWKQWRIRLGGGYTTLVDATRIRTSCAAFCILHFALVSPAHRAESHDPGRAHVVEHAHFAVRVA